MTYQLVILVIYFLLIHIHQIGIQKDIPSVGFNRAGDILDFRPRVQNFNLASTTGSPFSFNNRNFTSETPFVITPNESSSFRI